MSGPAYSVYVPLGRLVRLLPVFALVGNGETRVQPPHVDDVARAIAGVFTVEAPAKIYELGGPQIYTYRELLELLRSRLGTRTLLIPLPFALWHGLAAVAEQLPRPDRKSTRLNSSHSCASRMPSSA